MAEGGSRFLGRRDGLAIHQTYFILGRTARLGQYTHGVAGGGIFFTS